MSLSPELADKLASGDLTPMMRQYLTVKAEHPEAVVLFRMGDFFETFYEDAETCARLLDLTLTKRSKDTDAPPMAGVPHHAIQGYLARLVELGRTVVMVDQVEDPKKAKGLVRREVTRVVSPGTFVDPEAPARLPRYFVSVATPPVKGRARAGEAWGLAALDLATGELRGTAGRGAEALLDEVRRLAPRELIAAPELVAGPLLERARGELEGVAITSLVPAHADPDAALDTLKARLGAEEVEGVGRHLPPEALIAAGAALAYAEHTALRDASFEKKKGGSLAHIDRLQPYLPGEALILDAEARAHLELFQSAGDGGRRGTLLGVLDEAVTTMGGRLIARWLSAPLIDVARIRARHEAVDALVASPSRLDALRAQLREVYDLERLIGRVVMGRATPRALGALRGSLAALPDILAAAAEAEHVHRPEQAELEPGASAASAPPGRLSSLAAVDACLDVAAVIDAALVDAPPTELGGDRVFREGHDAELDRLWALSRDGKQVLADIERRERERTGISSLKVKYNRVFGYFIEVTKANLAAVPADYIRKQTTVNAERYFTEELKEYEEQVLGAEERRLERETTLFLELVRRVAAESRRLAALAAAAAETDALAALAHVAERHGWCRPEVDDGDRVEIADGRHPVIEALSSELGERFVPNDTRLGDEARLVIVTGPNMAGKSTIMRQTALIVLLAQLGAFVPASRARIGVVDRIFTRVGASDDLSRGRSTFMVEMTETARILRSATRRSLVLLDEIGRGTSTFDGLSIAWAVAEHLHDRIGAKTLFATHYHELTDLVRDRAQARNQHVAVKQWNDRIVFLRKLVDGPTNKSYGVQVARLAGLPGEVVTRAHEILADLEAQALRAGGHQPPARRGPEAGAQLSLFGGGGPTPDEQAVLDALRAVDPDELTPRQALELLADWRERLG
jgi:DNA mismatch repair protein MutS